MKNFWQETIDEIIIRKEDCAFEVETLKELLENVYVQIIAVSSQKTLKLEGGLYLTSLFECSCSGSCWPQQTIGRKKKLFSNFGGRLEIWRDEDLPDWEGYIYTKDEIYKIILEGFECLI